MAGNTKQRWYVSHTRGDRFLLSEGWIVFFYLLHTSKMDKIKEKYYHKMAELEGLTCEELMDKLRELYQKVKAEGRYTWLLEHAYERAEERMRILTAQIDDAEQFIKEECIWLYYDNEWYHEDEEWYMKEYEKNKKREEAREKKEMQSLYKNIFKR